MSKDAYKVNITSHKNHEFCTEKEKYFTDLVRAREYINSIIFNISGFTHQVKIDRIQVED